MSIVQTLCHKYSIPTGVTENMGMGATLKKDEQINFGLIVEAVAPKTLHCYIKA